MTVRPTIIQGGMGVGVSGWRLARAVSIQGHLGVVSGTALDTVMVRRLQIGDTDGRLREALSHVPIAGAAERILDRFFIEGGKKPTAKFQHVAMPSMAPEKFDTEVVVAANFVEVWLAKHDHDGVVGINYLEKIQVQTLASLYGALLAGVDYVLIGAGIPRAIPAAIKRLCEGIEARLAVDVQGAPSDSAATFTTFNPEMLFAEEPPILARPQFLAIIASNVLATMLVRTDVPPDGFVIESPTAGGHNAPPRGKLNLDDAGQPVYGKRDEVDLQAVAELGLPFWLAGMQTSPEAVTSARSKGAVGVQLGTAFAFCRESDLRDDLKTVVLERSRSGDLTVTTDPKASPTGFPFKIVELEQSLSDSTTYEERRRVCDLGYLRTAHYTGTGEIEWRCPSEPTAQFTSKGGSIVETDGRKCLCNALTANIGLGQTRRGVSESILLTAGDDAVAIARLLQPDATSYSAADVIDYVLPVED